MPTYQVTYTAMLIDADSEEEAIDRAIGDMRGGGHWEAKEVGFPVATSHYTWNGE
jgi:hypothetical protein